MAMFSFRENKHTNTLPSNLLRIYEPVESTNSLGDSFSGESLDLGSHHPPKLHRPLRTSVPPSDQATCFPSLITPVRFCSSHFSSCGLELQKKTVRHEDGENFHKIGVFPLPQTTTKTHKNKKYV